MKKQTSQYDKIFKENMEAVMPGLIERLLGITVVTSEEIPDDVQHTKERKPDALKKVTDASGETFILHIEVQVADEPMMIYRMAEYYIMLRRQYGLAVRQYVLYVGPKAPQMAFLLDEPRFRFDYSLIDFATIDYRILFQSPKPEQILLSILGDFGPDSAQQVLSAVVARIAETAPGDFAFKRYFQQLRVLIHLRNLEPLFKQIMDSLANYIDEERDVLFLRGEERGEKRGEKRGEERGETRAKRTFVIKLLRAGTYSSAEIADLADVPVSFVEQIGRELA